MKRRGSSGVVRVSEPLGALRIGYDITDTRARIELFYFGLGLFGRTR